MNLKPLRFMLLTGLLLAGSMLFAQEQQRAFSADTSKFLKELEAHFRNVGDNDAGEARAALSTFTYQWTSNLLPPRQKKQAHSICVLMNEKKLDVSPYFTGYFKTLSSLIKKNTDAKTFDVFHESVLYCLNSKTPARHVKQYFTQVELLVNQSALMKSPTEAWYLRGASSQLSFDTVPCFVVSAAGLAGVVRGDSACISGTKGRYYPLSQLWIGKGGKVTWERTGLGPDVVFAKLANYSIDTRSVSYSADSVQLYHGGYFKKFLQGRLDEKAMADVTPQDAVYPKFSMYRGSRVYINLFKDIEFTGRFSMAGADITGLPSDDGYCEIEVKQDQRPFITFRSAEIVLKPDRFVSARTSAVIYIDKDSVYHPSLKVRYNLSDNQMVMLRSDEGLSLSPFFDTYHRLDMFCDAIYWKMDENFMTFENQRGFRSKSDALFRSKDFYSAYEYDKMQAMDEVHPAVLVSAYARSRNTSLFYADEFAGWAKKPYEQIKVQLIKLANAGMLMYDLQRDQVKTLPRLNEYLAVRSGVKDSDILQFESSVPGSYNAILDLKTYLLTIQGIQRVILSDSQYVYVEPRNGKIIMGPDRNFSFNGSVHAGLFDFVSHECTFEYNKFKLSMPDIDSALMKIASWNTDANGYRSLVKVKNVLAGINGDLFIDAPDSKSGRKMLHNYPVLISKDTSYIYFDRPDIANGAYKRDGFYFRVQPFTLDSINSLPTGDLRFRGMLVSAGIFPDLPETVKVQKDYSLGFNTVLGSPGLPMYGGKGRFMDTLRLSNRGLRGTGRLNYLGSVTRSDDFLFLPGRATARVQNYLLAQNYGNVEFPKAEADESEITWNPGSDAMTVQNVKEETFKLFAGKAELRGSLTVTPAGTTGQGVLTFEDSEIRSKSFRFKNQSFTADTADLTLRTVDNKSEALKVHGFNSKIDLATRQGRFEATGKGAEMQFPLIKYRCSVSQFEWLMDKRQIALTNNTGFSRDEYYRMTPEELLSFDPGTELYTSTDPKQESLSFFAMHALYDFNRNSLEVEDARILKIADAAIFPDSAKLTVNMNGKIEELKMATILANRSSLLHKFFNASVNIASRNRYAAKGLYDYTPSDGEVVTLEVSNIEVDGKGHTVASTAISDSLGFMLNRYFAFKGKMSINAADSTVYFEGGYKMVHDCQALAQEWIKLHAGLNPKKIMIPVSSDEENTGNGNLRVSLYYSLTENTVLPGFFAKAENVSDPDIVKGSGYLVYDPVRQGYAVAEMPKLGNPNIRGNMLLLNTRRCTLSGAGSMQLGVNLGRLQMTSAGDITYYSLVDSTAARAMSALDFFFSADAMKVMADAMNASGASGIDVSSKAYADRLTELAGREEADRLITELGLYGQFRRFPDALDHTLVLADVNYVWNRDLRSFISKGPIGVGNTGTGMINKYMKGYVEIGKRRSGDIITIYLEPDENQWYYFAYSSGTMQALSSNKDFNDKLVGLKEKDRVIKGGQGLPSYQFIVGTAEKKAQFLRKMRQANGE